MNPEQNQQDLSGRRVTSHCDRRSHMGIYVGMLIEAEVGRCGWSCLTVSIFNVYS